MKRDTYDTLPEPIRLIQAAAPTPMRAFHGSMEIKKFYVGRVRAHREADEIKHGFYWQGGKGCAVGCTIHGSKHSRYETELGIPRQLAWLKDGIFKALPSDAAKLWPEQFLEAIPVGANLIVAYWQFMKWLFVDPEEGVIKDARKEATKGAIKAAGDLYARLVKGGAVTEVEWRATYGVATALAFADNAIVAAIFAAPYDDTAVVATAAFADTAVARFNAHVRHSEKLLELMRAAPLA